MGRERFLTLLAGLWVPGLLAGGTTVTLVSCGDDQEELGVHSGADDSTASDDPGDAGSDRSDDGESDTDTSNTGTSDTDTSHTGTNDADDTDPTDADDASSSDDALSDGGVSEGGVPDSSQDDTTAGPTASQPQTEPATDTSATASMPTQGPDSAVDDIGSGGSDEPDSGMLDRGLGADELVEGLQRYWLTDARVGGCGDLFRYEYFAAPSDFTRLVYSTPGCSTAYPDGGSEYPGTYQLSDRRLSVTQADTVMQEQYDIAIEQTTSGLVLHPGIYLLTTQTAWTRQATRERRDDEGALQWSIASSVAVDFGAVLPLADGATCSVNVNVELQFAGLDPEGEFLLEFGPYACTVQQASPQFVVAVPMPTAEELALLDTLAADTVQEIWPSQLRLPRASAEYLLTAVGYREIAESDVQR